MTLPRKTILAVSCTAVLCPCVSAAAQTASADSCRAGIEAAYNQIGSAFTQHDLNRFMAWFAPDYVSVGEKGEKRCKDQERQYYQDQMNKIKTLQSHYIFQSVSVTPAGTLVEMRMHAEGTGERRILFARIHGTFTNDTLVRDLWVNTPDGWRLKSRQTLENETHIHPG